MQVEKAYALLAGAYPHYKPNREHLRSWEMYLSGFDAGVLAKVVERAPRMWPKFMPSAGELADACFAEERRQRLYAQPSTAPSIAVEVEDELDPGNPFYALAAKWERENAAGWRNNWDSGKQRLRELLETLERNPIGRGR